MWRPMWASTDLEVLPCFRNHPQSLNLQAGFGPDFILTGPGRAGVYVFQNIDNLKTTYIYVCNIFIYSREGHSLSSLKIEPGMYNKAHFHLCACFILVRCSFTGVIHKDLKPENVMLSHARGNLQEPEMRHSA